MPSNVKVSPNGTTILNIVAKLKNSYQLSSAKNDSEGESPKTPSRMEKYNHLLIAKVKDTYIMFSFIIEASVIEAASGNNNMS